MKRPRICSECSRLLATPRVKRCPTCKRLWSLFQGIWNRLLYNDKYSHLSIESVVSWRRFRSKFWNLVHDHILSRSVVRLSVDRLDAAKTYLEDNIRIIDKRLNSGRRRTNVFHSFEQTGKLFRLRLAGWSLDTIAAEFECSRHSVWYQLEKMKALPLLGAMLRNAKKSRPRRK